MATQDHLSSKSLEGVQEFESLIASARAGDATAQELVHAKCQKYLLLIANREIDPPLRVKLGASDVVQETLLCAQRHLGQFQGRTVGELRAWLRAILLNNLRTARRRYCRGGMRDLARERTIEGGLLEQGPQHALVDSDTPSRQIVAGEQDAQLKAALDTLPDDYRLAVLMRNFDRSSFAEIGRVLGRSEAAARKLWLRAIDRLAKLLGAEDELA